MYEMTTVDENVMLSVVYQYVVPPDREVYLNGKGSDVHEEVKAVLVLVCGISLCF